MPKPREVAREWALAMAAAGRVVGPAVELPEAAAARILEREGVLLPALDRAAWILRNPAASPDPDAVRRQVYWPLVAELLGHYAPAALDRSSAVRLWLGEATPPPSLYVRHGRSETERRYEVAPGLSIVLTPMPAGVAPAAAGLPSSGANAPGQVAVADTVLSVVTPAWALLAMPLGELRDEYARVSAWLRGLILPAPELAAAYGALPRPLVAGRLAHLAEELGNTTLATRLRDTIRDHGARVPSRTKTAIGLTPAPVIRSAPAHESPWITRFRDQLSRGLDDLRKADSPASPALSLAERLEFARATKRDDVYHSTTIEGYKVTPADLDAVFSGRPVAGRTPEEVERLLALKGYAAAFDRTLELLPSDSDPIHITAGVVLDLYVQLWLPSVDAGIVSASALRQFRGRQAFLAGSRYVPPAPEKVPALVDELGRFLDAAAPSGAERAALAHWGFETIHPFPDGNGRVGRLLMNLLLGSEGYPWVTIRAEDRPQYFASLERGQVDGDLGNWARFFFEYLSNAIARATLVTTATAKATKGKQPKRGNG